VTWFWVERSKVKVTKCIFTLMTNSKTNDPNVFKFGTGNDIEISYKRYGFGVERSKVEVRVRVNSSAVWVQTL